MFKCGNGYITGRGDICKESLSAGSLDLFAYRISLVQTFLWSAKIYKLMYRSVSLACLLIHIISNFRRFVNVDLFYRPFFKSNLALSCDISHPILSFSNPYIVIAFHRLYNNSVCFIFPPSILNYTL